MDIFNSSNRQYDPIHTNKKKERKKMVVPEFRYNDMTEHWDVEILCKLGDLKERVCIASVNKETNTITFWKTISINDLRSIMLRWEEHSFMLDRPRPALNNLKPKVRFEPEPDGVGSE